MKKRVLSAALSLCLLLTLLPTAALATEDETTTVAKIGEQGYSTLADAVVAATNAETAEGKVIDLQADTTLQEKVTITGDVTINGNKKTITGSTNSTDTYFEITGGTLTISDATLTDFGDTAGTTVGAGVFKIPSTASGAKLVATIEKFNRAAVDVRNGEFELQNCKIDCDNKQTQSLTKGVVAGYDSIGTVTGSIKECEITGPNSTYDGWSSNGIEVSCGATVTIEKTSITSLKGGISVARNYGHDEANVTVTDCAIDAKDYALRIFESNNSTNPVDDTSAFLTVNGGTYTGDVRISKKDSGEVDGKSAISIKAGTFSANVTDFLAEGTTLYSTQDTVDTWGEYIAVLGNVTVPGSDLKYSGVPAIYAAMAKGYSDLWALGNYTTVPQTEALDALKASLLKTVQDYTLDLLETAYNEGNGYQVGDTTYMMPKQAYTAAKAAINDTSDLSAILTAYQTAVDSQYIKDALGIASVGFQADAEAANGAINEIIKGLDGTAGSVKDCDANTMYIALSQRTSADDQQGYDVKVTNEAGETVYSEEIAENEAAGVIYFTFESNGGSHATKALASGTYTVSLLKSGWTDPINTMTITLAQVSYNTNGGTPEAIASFYTDTNNTVTLPVAPNKSGYTFDGWKSSADNNVTQAGAKVAVSADTTFTAQWSKRSSGSHGGSGSSGGSASTTYTLTFESNGGSAISKVTKNKGTTIDLAQYAPTKSGAMFDGWYADKGLTKKITSVKLDANTTVYAKWTETPVSSLPFGDVKSADWFYNDVKYVYEKGMMAGTAADVFAPNATTTRAMIVTILYRLEGSPAVTGTSAFVDVPAGQWYTDAVNWAAANQIVKGTSATTFAPNDSITREQMAAILYRYAQYKGYDVTKKADLSGYSDNGQVSAYAKDALAWANAAKLINGVTNTTLAPQGNATRAQVSAILHRFCDGVVK